MMSQTDMLLAAVLVLVAADLIIHLVRRPSAPDVSALATRADVERAERTAREGVAETRGAVADESKRLRDEVASGLQQAREGTLQQLDVMARAQNESLASFGARVEHLSTSNEQRLVAIRDTVDGRLRTLQEDNAQKLEQMRATVDEKLQATLETRLAESFRLVSERLELVHRGLGEMQQLAQGVGDLKKVLSNVKARGTWGEVQLEALLEQVLVPEQYGKNVNTRGEGGEMVEFAVKLPGDGGGQDFVWLPIDSKFPIEDYQRLLAAQDLADRDAVDAAARALEARVRACAKDIRQKYLAPPRTTDVGVLFLPAEGLYAEVLRRPGLVEALQREHGVCVAGPTTLLAILNALRMGFRTLAIQKRSTEVWTVLGQVKNEFSKFDTVLAKVGKKLQEASNVVDDAARRTRVMGRTLKNVESLPLPDGVFEQSVVPALTAEIAEPESPDKTLVS